MCSWLPVSAANESPKVVKVGFPIQSFATYINERGYYDGYLVDYLTHLTGFTNWEIEYVQVEGDLDTQLETLMFMLLDGEIDILGTMNRNATLEKMFLYPDDSYGTRYTALAVLKDQLKWIENDFMGWDNIRVAAYAGNQKQIEQFANYAAVNDFVYELVQYGSEEEMIQAVEDGKADALIQPDISLTDDFRIIGRFSPTPYYFALSPNNTDLLAELNAAMQGLMATQPNLQAELYDQHFRHTDSFTISDENRAFVQSLGTLKVLFFVGDAPYQYIKDGELTGFAVEYFDKFAELTGLQYEPVIASSYDEVLELVQNGQADLIACIATTSPLAALGNVRFTTPYFNSFSVSACTNQRPHEHAMNLEFRIDTAAALEDIKSQTGYGIRADYYSLSYYLRKKVVYDKVVVDWTNVRDFSYTIGAASSIPQELITMLNQYASSTDEMTKQEILYRYSSDAVEYTFSEWLLVNHSMIIAAAFCLIVLLVVALVYLRSRHMAYQTLLAENRLMQLSMYDRITGAYNETYFRKLLEQSCNEQKAIALVAFNIRGFKYINDTYGVKRADDTLCEIKTVLESDIQEEEFFCRPSADLFYLALQEHSADHLITRTNGIFAKIIQTVTATLDGHPLSLYSGAVFVADSPAPYRVSPNISYLMIALAHARQLSDPQICIFDETLYRDQQLHYYIETHMEVALVHEEYLLYLQPKMNLRTGQVDEAEALVRWHPTGHGIIYPDQFIPIFEENGFCIQLDLYMVEQVCKLLRTWMEAGIPPIAISVNQTKALFVKEDYVERLLAITQQYDIPPQYIVLEILEGLAFENFEELNRTIRKLNDVGFRVAIDDFGSGYSSLNTLGKLDIDEVKLDRLFLLDVMQEGNGAQKEVLASILSLAKRLGMRTVAEGVETQESEDMIRTMHCDYGQGYYYSKPIPAEEFRLRFCH